MGRVIKYSHRSKIVYGDIDHLGEHQAHCLCRRCRKFSTNSENSCSIVQELSNINKVHNITTSVWLCPNFEEKTNEDLCE